MKVYEINMLVFLLEDINLEDAFSEVANFIDSGLATIPELLDLHEKNIFKNYCFNGFYPLEKDKIYKKNKQYKIQLRTIDEKLAKFFYEKLVNHYNKTIKGLTADIKIIPKKHIEKLYSITPTIVKSNDGYWKNSMTLEDFERRLKENSIKKNNNFNNIKMSEDFSLYTSIEFKNSKPIAMKYKNVKLLGDKLNIYISDDRVSQEIAYMLLGTGILEFNGRGAGYVNYKWL